MLDKRSIVTVTTPAATYDLVLLADVHTELGIATTDTSNDLWFAAAITRVSAAVARYCRRTFPVESLTEQIYPAIDPFPYQVPGRVAPLQLARWPLVEVASVTVAESLDDAEAYTAGTDFIADPGTGQLFKLNPFTGYQSTWDPVPMTVVYSAGYATIPPDLQYAVLQLITSAWKSRGQDDRLMGVTEQGVERRYWVDTGKDGAFPPNVRETLDAYRVPMVA